ncbi:hypothetical protein CEXT_41061 [Caerostris extrusa]|uniref:Uncharacterized protein n=1 Tax=Caerostris extrusa TaxID=172846 RepID=A0AAV4QDA5_CAEEX|nr:hypothetical protein CEXT_41061 [Caerostris extrusa]
MRNVTDCKITANHTSNLIRRNSNIRSNSKDMRIELFLLHRTLSAKPFPAPTIQPNHSCNCHSCSSHSCPCHSCSSHHAPAIPARAMPARPFLSAPIIPPAIPA